MAIVVPRRLRLNEIVDENNTPLIPLTISEAWGVEKDEALAAMLYDIMTRSYMWSKINYDDKEQFVYWLKYYWEKTLPRYIPIIKAQVELSENMYKARIEKFKGGRTETTTPELETVTKYELGDTVSLEHGRKLTHERNLNEGAKTTQYEQQLVDDNRTLGGDETNTYSGTDKTVRSGVNTDTRNERGKSTLAIEHNDDNTVTVYDAEKFRAVLITMNVTDSFIDEFSPLFESVLFFS